MNKKIRALGALLLVILWGALTAFAWFAPAKESSDSERRLLAQFPAFTGKNILSGKFMSDFEDYATDQFPLRDGFRGIKALTHRYALLQADNNDIYLADGYLVKQEYPLNQESVDNALKRLNWVYDNYLKETGSKVYLSIIPDKNYYLAQPSGHLAMDYGSLISQMQTGLPYAAYIDVTGSLSASNYYYTDTHWRQETLQETAGVICRALDMPAQATGNFAVRIATDSFRGVYHGQAALPLPDETLRILVNERLEAYQVSIHNGMGFVPVAYEGVYDMEKLTSKDPYDVFLSGPQSLIRIENPNAKTDKELIIFRDSFGSSIAPLLVAEYKTVTLVDIRYLDSRMLGRYLDFHGQDVLFLYSTLVLNSNMLK